MGAALQFSIVSMPHAALWVVQLCSQISSSVSATCFNAARGFVGGAASRSLLGFWVHTSFNAARGFVGGAADYTGCIVWCAVWFQCRTRLCGWCSNIPVRKVNYINCVSMPHAALWVVQHLCETYWCGAASVSMPHAALWVVQHYFRLSEEDRAWRFNAARGFVGGAASCKQKKHGSLQVSMPHAALWVVQRQSKVQRQIHRIVSMPHAALWVVQHYIMKVTKAFVKVSMPHAALWVVQL